ncbi:molybdopterin synthase catalytic subunit [Harpegnathos saltator]|uniref:Molybdopterin synthase catalytic subunit n=1 Tax=Harpegnathos saltator TaxID=610380 RepID=E2BHL1_HARSA|nr:molybdopterin synthase catalytic subunit [Harpegnathos saltator]EFN84820.1 Molybdenum cofactor synthesis protein 2 large subunit [Harpegnathos saltator]
MESPKNFIKLQQEELDIADIINLVVFPNCGAVSNFIGITRDNFENKKVVKLEYEAYEGMAIKEMNNICTKIRLQWNVEGIAIYHRIGEVPISKASVVIAISSPHREESLKAVEYAINTLKAIVPIWKKEVYETGEPEWKQNKECTWKNISNNVSEVEEIIESTALRKNNVQVTANVNEDIPDKVIIDPNHVQIQASPEELNRRIESFIERKRQQVNIVNVREFCCHSEQNEDNKNSCARVDAILMHRNDSKSHMKVHRVFNIWGPQMVDQSALRKLSSSTSPNSANPFPVLDERISISERILGINKPVPKDIYKRLKIIEDKILYLEGISPEYKEFWITKDIDILKGNLKSVQKRTYSMAEIDSKLYELEEKYSKRIK